MGIASGAAVKRLRHNLDFMNPAANDVKLGIFMYAVAADLALLQTNFNAFLTHVDTANVGGIGNTNAATYGVAFTNSLPPSIIP